jgi:hypothetical protein
MLLFIARISKDMWHFFIYILLNFALGTAYDAAVQPMM